jgi:UDP-galactopyranose mutase
VDIVCFSHLRWDFVFQRPQHLMQQSARRHRVFYFEEPIVRPALRAHITPRIPNVEVVVPHFPPELPVDQWDDTHRRLIDDVLERYGVRDFVLWLTTPMPVPATRHLAPVATIYDCMDELSAFKDAPPVLIDREQELLRNADVVFTGGRSLYAAKRALHPRVRCFPSSIDVAHFVGARAPSREPFDQRPIPHPRLGFCGVIDERTDLTLLDGLARAHPNWQLILLGPVVKIDPSTLPRGPNIHHLGFKWYPELPDYLAGWDVALLPFAHNESTRFISPTKTLEYLAAGLPVVSTHVRDVVATFGQRGLVDVADGVADTAAAVHRALQADGAERAARLASYDAYLRRTSWERTWQAMWRHVRRAIRDRRALSAEVDTRSSQVGAMGLDG